MKKQDYGELKFSIEIRENAVIVDGAIPVKYIKALSDFSEKIIPGGMLEETCSDCRNGGMTIIQKEQP